MATYQDTFTRANTTASTSIASGWGAASDGESWSSQGTAATWQIQGNEGTVTNLNGTAQALLGSTVLSDIDTRVRLSASNSSDIAGVVFGFTDTNNYYRVRVSNTQLLMEKKLAGVTTALSTISFIRASATFYSLHMRMLNGNMHASIWLASGSESIAWTALATDSSPLPAGQFGLFINPNGTTHILSFDSFVVSSVPVAKFPATSRRTGQFPATSRRTGQFPAAKRRTF